MADSSYKEQSAEDIKLLNEAKPLISDAYNFARKQFQERKVYNDLYYVQDENYKRKKKDHQAKFLSPQYQSYAEQKISLYAQGLTGTDIQPFFIYTPKDNMYASKAAQGLTKMVYTDLMQDFYYETNYKTSHHYVVDGFAIEKPWWKFTTRTFYPEDQQEIIIDEFGATKVQNYKPDPYQIPDKNHITVKSISPNDLWIDPGARNEEELRYVIERLVVPYSFLKLQEAQGIYKNVDLVKSTNFPIRGDMNDLLNSMSHSRRDYESYYQPRLVNKAIDKEDPLVELAVVWRRGYFYTIANERIVVSSPMSFNWLKEAFPFEFYSNYPSNYKFGGLSEFYFNESLIRETNKLANMLIDNVYRHLNPMTFVNGILPSEDIQKIKSGDGNIVIEAAGADIMNQFRPELPSNAVVSLLDSFVERTKDSMAVSDLMASQSPGSEFRTTGSIQILAQMGQIRSAVKLQMLAGRKRNIGKRLLSIYRNFLTEDRAIAVGGGAAPELLNITNQDLNLDYNIDVNIAPAADILRSQELQAMRGLFLDGLNVPGVRTNRMYSEIITKAGVFQDPTGLVDQNVIAIENRNVLDAKALGLPSDPSFTGAVAPPGVPGVGAGGSTQTNAVNQTNGVGAPV